VSNFFVDSVGAQGSSNRNKVYVCTTIKCGATPRANTIKDNKCPECKQPFTEVAVSKKNVVAVKSAVGSPPKDLDGGDTEMQVKLGKRGSPA
jgi:Tfp pilus assembly protein PilX